MSGSNVDRPRRQRMLGTGPSPRRRRCTCVSWTVPDRLEQLRRRGLHGERTGTVEVRPAWAVIAAFLGWRSPALVLLLAIPAG